MWKSLMAVVAGVVTLTVTSFGVEFVVNPLLMRAFPDKLPNVAALARNEWVWAGTLAYSLLCIALGGYVSARLAPRLPFRHAVGLGVLQMGLTVLAMWSLPGVASVEQWLFTAAASLPAAAAGGHWFVRQQAVA